MRGHQPVAALPPALPFKALLLAMLLLSPLAVHAQPPSRGPQSRVAQRLPPAGPSEAPANRNGRAAETHPSQAKVQPTRFLHSTTQPNAELLWPVAIAPKPVAAGSLTLSDLESMALTCNPSIARAAAMAQAARGKYIQVGLPPNPSIGFEGQQLGSGGLAEQYGVFVGQEFVRGGKLSLNREVAAQEWAQAEQHLASQQQRVLTDVRLAYFDLLAAQRQEQLTGELLRVARETQTVTEKLFHGKEVGRVDVVQAQIEANSTEILTENAYNRRIAAWQGLATVVGNPNFAPQPVAGDLEAPRGEYDWHESLQRILATSPEMAAAVANVERARWAVERARVEKTPNLSVQGLVNVRDNGIDGRPDGTLTVGIPLPAWNRNQGGVIQAEHEVVAAERARDQLELALQNRLAVVYERYANARKQVDRYRTNILPAARESLTLTDQLFRSGETGYGSLLTSQRTYSQTHLNYLESLRTLRAGEVQIEGLLLSGSLDER